MPLCSWFTCTLQATASSGFAGALSKSPRVTDWVCLVCCRVKLDERFFQHNFSSWPKVVLQTPCVLRGANEPWKQVQPSMQCDRSLNW